MESPTSIWSSKFRLKDPLVPPRLRSGIEIPRGSMLLLLDTLQLIVRVTHVVEAGTTRRWTLP